MGVAGALQPFLLSQLVPSQNSVSSPSTHPPPSPFPHNFGGRFSSASSNPPIRMLSHRSLSSSLPLKIEGCWRDPSVLLLFFQSHIPSRSCQSHDLPFIFNDSLLLRHTILPSQPLLRRKSTSWLSFNFSTSHPLILVSFQLHSRRKSLRAILYLFILSCHSSSLEATTVECRR